MKKRIVKFRLSALSLAMISAVASMYAYADDEEAAALMNPTSTVTVEEIYVSQGSQKFGEYNGLNKQGGYVNGNLNIRGGDAYKGNAAGGTQRWSVIGTDLGLTDRSASAGYSDQGNWGAQVGYDALQHNLAPGYQTPYQGQMGGNGWTLPSNFGPNGVLTPYPSATQLGTTTGLTQTQKNAIQNLEVYSTRQNTSFSASKIIDPSLNVTFDFNHLDQSGAKLMGFVSSGLGGTSYQTKNGTDGTAAYLNGGEKTSILPNPTNYQTDTVNLALNWQGEKARLTGSYFGSFFRDAYNGVSFQTWNNTMPTQTMSTAPSNQMQQLNLGGGYDFSSKTKLAGNLSFGRNTQNSTSSVDPYMMNGNTPAFNGLVNTSHIDLKLTDKTIQDLSLAGGYKFDQRNNLTQSNIYNFNQIAQYSSNGNGTGYTPFTNAGGQTSAFSPNTPLSIRNSQIDLGGEYKVTKDQKASFNYTNLQTARWCNQYAVGSTGTPPAGTAYYYNFPAGADCVTANYSRSNVANVGYKIKASDTFDVKLNYIYDIRKTTYNQNAITAVDVSGTSGKNVNNVPVNQGFLPGQNGGDYIGYQPFFEASRNQQVMKLRANWHADEKTTLGLTGKYTSATYPNSTYGVQNSNGWNLSLDAAYQYAEEGIVTAYAVQQNGQRNLMNYTSTGTGTWMNSLEQHDTTLGMGVNHGGLFSGKLNLKGDVTYSLGQSFYNTSPGSNTSSSYTYANGSYGAPPAIRNDLVAIKLGGIYQIDKRSKVGLQYMYQRLLSTDYYYNGLQTGYTPSSVMPTNQNSGSYNVNVITVGYNYSFD